MKSLPKPTGLLAWNDVRGRQITEACRHCRIKVPEEIAVIGGGMDELLGDISFPPLTTVDPSAKQVGFQAASLLHKIMSGEKPLTLKTLIPPAGVITKQSTDILAVKDKYLVKALTFIRENALKKIGVDDVVRQVPLSRRSLEQHFRDELGFSPADEIRKIKLEHARQLLINTYWPIAKIAFACGYRTSEIFTRAFSKYYKQSPLACRKANYL